MHASPVPTTPVASDGDTLDHGRFDVYTRLLKDRIVFLGTDVNDEMANFIIAPVSYTHLTLPTTPYV